LRARALSVEKAQARRVRIFQPGLIILNHLHHLHPDLNIMAEWRVSEEQPLRYLEGLDYERCAALHNYIIELGWTQRGLALDALDKRTWWECHGGDAALTGISERLEAPVVSFLKLAWNGFSMDGSGPVHLFHRYLGGLCYPHRLWDNINYAEDEDDSNKRSYITLYEANHALGTTHAKGLILDQDYGLAMQHMSIAHTGIAMNGRQTWLSLEMILNEFIDMIDQGKVVAVDEAYSGDQERTEPWIMPSYTQRDLDDTLGAFQQLVNTINDKLPSQPLDTEIGLLNLVTGGDQQRLPSNSFAHQFLVRSPVPSFTYLAPGLRIAQHQPFALPPEDENEPNKLSPLLLFSSTQPAHQETVRSPWGVMSVSSFTGEIGTASVYPAGLYLTETDPCGMHPFEDGCKLILPYTLGANAFARTSDDALIGEDLGRTEEDVAAHVQPTSTQLYQLGFNHFIAKHDVQLKHVLWRWVEMIEDGKWEVDADGVVGGIEKWKEADTEEHWMDYQLPMSW
jgi:hypothetical protein